MLWPPVTKVYQDGRIIFYSPKDRKFFAGNVEPKRLERLKRQLADEKFLKDSRFVEMKGDPINIHGGISYIRYLDGDDEVLISTDVRPRGGKWQGIVNSVRDCLPREYAVFYPETIVVHTWVDTSSRPLSTKPTAWPFSDRVKLSADLKSISSKEIVRFLFDGLEGSFSFFAWDFIESGTRYSMALESAPDWYNDDGLEIALAQLRWEWGEHQKEREVNGRSNKNSRP